MKLTRENLFTYLNLHLLIAGILVLANIVLLTRLVLAWNTLRNDRPEQIAALQSNLKVLQLQNQPLRGLPTKVDASREQAKKFYNTRMPANYSSISAELDQLAQKNNVHEGGVAYTPVPIFPDLKEVGLDVRLAGDYEPIMRYINGLERDKTFFIIRGLTFTGQQGGAVGLRLRLTTYIHAPDVDQMTAPADSIPKPAAGTEPVTGDSSDRTSPSASLQLPAVSAGGQ